MTAISTVRIKSADTASGFIIVNEADFDPAKQRLWETEPATQAAAKPAPGNDAIPRTREKKKPERE